MLLFSLIINASAFCVCGFAATVSDEVSWRALFVVLCGLNAGFVGASIVKVSSLLGISA